MNISAVYFLLVIYYITSSTIVEIKGNHYSFILATGIFLSTIVEIKGNHYSDID